MTMLDHFIGL